MLVFVYILVFRLNFGVSVFRESKRPEAQPTTSSRDYSLKEFGSKRQEPQGTVKPSDLKSKRLRNKSKKQEQI